MSYAITDKNQENTAGNHKIIKQLEQIMTWKRSSHRDLGGLSFRTENRFFNVLCVALKELKQ